jgi:hypothetical protein
MISRVPGVRTISESFVFVFLHGLYNKGKITMPEYRELLRSVVRLQLKKEKKVCAPGSTLNIREVGIDHLGLPDVQIPIEHPIKHQFIYSASASHLCQIVWVHGYGSAHDQGYVSQLEIAVQYERL